VNVQNLPDLIRLTDLESCIIDAYGEMGKELSDELEYLPAGFGEHVLLKDLTLCKMCLLKDLTLCHLVALQELPNLSGLTALQHLVISYCPKIKRIGKLGALLPLKKLELEDLSELQELPDLRGFTGLKTLHIRNYPELRNMLERIVELTALKKHIDVRFKHVAQSIREGVARVRYASTKWNYSDLMTKPLAELDFSISGIYVCIQNLE
jgi:hypothetical protein